MKRCLSCDIDYEGAACERCGARNPRPRARLELSPKESREYRILGLLTAAASVTGAYFLVIRPLQEAASHAPTIEIPLKFLWLAVMGALGGLFYAAVPRFAHELLKSPFTSWRGILAVAVIAIAALTFTDILESKLEGMGYTHPRILRR